MLFVRQQPIATPTPSGRRRAPLSHSKATAAPVPSHWQSQQQPYRHTPNANEPLDLEALALAAGSEYEDTWRSTRWRSDSSSSSTSHYSDTCTGGSGLPLVCSNCGVSFFSLQVTDDELECYCSGECKWSVVMYREMDRRMHALRRHLRATATTSATTTSQDATTKTAKSFSSSSSPSSVSSMPSSSGSSAATVESENCESYPRLLDDVIACR